MLNECREQPDLFGLTIPKFCLPLPTRHRFMPRSSLQGPTCQASPPRESSPNSPIHRLPRSRRRQATFARPPRRRTRRQPRRLKISLRSSHRSLPLRGPTASLLLSPASVTGCTVGSSRFLDLWTAGAGHDGWRPRWPRRLR